MKKTIKFLSFVLLAGALFISCEGPEGPAGVDGTDGNDGVAGNFSCLECHSAVVMDAIGNQFEMSKHSEGTSFSYAGTRSDCGRCHSSEAYIEFVLSGKEIAGHGESLQCETCHNNHSSLEDSISAPIRNVGNVVSVIDGTELESHGKGNLCATCHQARTNAAEVSDAFSVDTLITKKVTGSTLIAFYQATGAPIGTGGTTTLNGTSDTLTVVFDVPTTSAFISSSHAGPHHGPQANMFEGTVGATTGTAFTRTTPIDHTDCVNCHLNDTTTAGGFGHTFAPDIAQCDACHGSSVDVEGIMAANQTRIDAIAAELVARKIITTDVTTDVKIANVTRYMASITQDEFVAWYNFISILEDRSLGIHNNGYTKQMLSAAETKLGLK